MICQNKTFLECDIAKLTVIFACPAIAVVVAALNEDADHKRRLPESQHRGAALLSPIQSKTLLEVGNSCRWGRLGLRSK